MQLPAKSFHALILGFCTTCVVAGGATAKDDGNSRYTRLDASGAEVQRAVTQPEQARCVKDNVTSLVWELKTDDGGIHDRDNTYRWGGLGVEQAPRTVENRTDVRFDDWNSLVVGANQEALCGFKDWRVPTIDELQTLISAGREPAIEPEYFPLTLPRPYWSASSFEKFPEHGQNVHFGNGTSYYYNGYRGNALPVRLVRGNWMH